MKSTTCAATLAAIMLWLSSAGAASAMYHPTLGRFLSRDPIGYDGGDVNLYRYVADAPTNGIDPGGTDIVVETGNDTYNPVNNAVHQSICVDTWRSCQDPKPSGKRCFSFGASGFDFWFGSTWLGHPSKKCCIVTGTVYEARPVAGATPVAGKKTTCAQDMAFLNRMINMLGMQDGYSVARHGCRTFSQLELGTAPGTPMTRVCLRWGPEHIVGGKPGAPVWGKDCLEWGLQ